MIHNIPTLGIRFDIDKLESGAYGMAAWEIFWRAVDIDSLKGDTLLFEGNTAATIKSQENVYCIVVQSITADLRAVRSALEQSAGFRSVTASPPFVEAADVLEEPLLEAGRIDSEGNLVGKKAYNARPALGTIRKERQGGLQASQLSATVPEREKPASRRTEKLPNISTLEELLDFLLTRFSEKEKVLFWLTPEELCDIVEHYANILQVQWYEASCSLSENMAYVTLFDKGKAGNNIALYGLFPFAMESDAKDFCYDKGENPDYLFGQLEKLWGIHGKFASNFSGESNSNWVHEDSYDKRQDIDAFNLWPRICRRRQVLGISAPITKDSISKEEKVAEKTVQDVSSSFKDIRAQHVSKPSTQVKQTSQELCKRCGEYYEKGKITCPHCGKTQWGAIITFLFLGWLFLMVGMIIIDLNGNVFLTILFLVVGALIIFGSIRLIKNAVKIRKTKKKVIVLKERKDNIGFCTKCNKKGVLAMSKFYYGNKVSESSSRTDTGWLLKTKFKVIGSKEFLFCSDCLEEMKRNKKKLRKTFWIYYLVGFPLWLILFIFLTMQAHEIGFLGVIILGIFLLARWVPRIKKTQSDIKTLERKTDTEKLEQLLDEEAIIIYKEKRNSQEFQNLLYWTRLEYSKLDVIIQPF